MTPFCGISVSTERGTSTEHNIRPGVVRGLVSRSASAPTAAEWPLQPNITSTPKPWQSFAHGITDAHAAIPVTLHPLDLLVGQQGVGDVLVIGEHRVVAHHGGVYSDV